MRRWFFDHTLVDTFANSLNDVLTRRGHDAIPAGTLGARAMIEEGLRRAGAHEDQPVVTEFLVHYEANIADETRSFPGAVTSLEALSRQA